MSKETQRESAYTKNFLYGSVWNIKYQKVNSNGLQY